MDAPNNGKMKKSPARSRSPARNKSPARPKSAPKSPGRPKSPARTKSPARAKSPARPKSPSRRSPARKAAPRAPRAVVQIERLSATPQRDEKTPDIVERIAELRNSQSRERSRAVEEIRVSLPKSVPSYIEDNDTESTGVTLRRSARVKTYNVDGLKKSIDDQVDRIIKTNHVSGDYAADPREFGNWPGVLFLIAFIPAFVVGLQMSCMSKDKCKPLDFSISYNWKYYLDPIPTLWLTGFLTWQFLLSSLPLNKQVSGISSRGTALQYRCSGIVNALLTLSILGTLQYFKYPVTSILSKTVALLVSSIIVGTLLSLVLFIKGGRSNPNKKTYSNSGNRLYDFFVGREVNPRFGPVDVKLTLARAAIIGALIYDAAVVVRTIENKPFPNYPPTILVVTALQILTFIDFLIFEENFLSSFYIQHEGAGFLLVTGTLLFPFLITFIPKYVYIQSVDINAYYLAVLTLFYVLAYAIYRVSSSQKHNFRRNPLSPSVAHLDSIPAIGGKKILCGGCWGIVRHPNYLGLILMYWLLSVCAGVQHWAPYAVSLAVTVILGQRAVRDNARCRRTHGSSWDRYTQKVKNYLVPRVF